VEAPGVELSGVLTARKLLIIGTATTAKRPHCTDPFYVYCTKMLTLWEPADPHSNHSILWIRRSGSRENTPLPPIPQASPLEEAPQRDLGRQTSTA
jgi:hypothetical protein